MTPGESPTAQKLASCEVRLNVLEVGHREVVDTVREQNSKIANLGAQMAAIQARSVCGMHDHLRQELEEKMQKMAGELWAEVNFFRRLLIGTLLTAIGCLIGIGLNLLFQISIHSNQMNHVNDQAKTQMLHK